VKLRGVGFGGLEVDESDVRNLILEQTDNRIYEICSKKLN